MMFAACAETSSRRLGSKRAPRPRGACPRSGMTRRTGFTAMCFLLCCHLLATALFPMQAHATYADVTPDYQASQELGVLDAPIAASSIPDGVYDVPAKSSSAMCILSNPFTGSSNSCRITVAGGSMVATFTLSGAYTAVYRGTAEMAASLSVDGGVTDEYIIGDPASGYTPHEYSIYITALNEPFDMATFNGGTKSFEEAVWYSRTVVIKSNDAVDEALGEAESPDVGDDDPGIAAGQPDDLVSTVAEEPENEAPRQPVHMDGSSPTTAAPSASSTLRTVTAPGSTADESTTATSSSGFTGVRLTFADRGESDPVGSGDEGGGAPLVGHAAFGVPVLVGAFTVLSCLVGFLLQAFRFRLGLRFDAGNQYSPDAGVGNQSTPDATR